ncbi:M12 family metallo-peptidase [uncultured Aquimarina sp.]|uniref:M12 family metallo-peptidase n=1 Tax=uncultured Aquimarina sp. TaxID=575652 RepID=UPI002609E3CF|nr:M12 family metallo-peptidase [uncultured Aquimarina sp.]
MRSIFTFLVILLMTSSFVVQSQNIKPKHQVKFAKISGKSFKEVSLFDLKTEKSKVSIPKEFKNYSILSLQSSELKNLISSLPEVINFSLPGKKSSMLLELIKVEVKTDNFSIVEMPSGKIIKPNNEIIHYRGIVKNSPNSIAAISILKGEVSGIISIEGEIGNLVLGKLDHSKDHILYEDRDISHLNDFVCQLQDVHKHQNQEINTTDFSKTSPSENQVKCPEIFFDIGNDVVRDKGGSQAAANFVEAMFNQVAILYANEDVKIKLSGIRSWTSSNPFNDLDSYRSYRNQNGFNGDLAHFVTYNYSGGVAWLNALCGSYRYGLSGINRSYENVPRYSWNISTIAHELGHNFGSNHTHSCAWNGNNTAIDGCYNTEGGCSKPGIPSDGGTIMSYCHLTSVGTNLRKGFGSQPSNVIRTNIRRADCISTCNGNGDGDGDQVDCTGINEWSDSVDYTAGDKVVYLGRLFERTPANDWDDLGECSPDLCAIAVQWAENTTYAPGDVVIYQGNVWLRIENNDWEAVDCDIVTNDPCLGINAWSGDANYSANDQVVYVGKVFEWNGTEWIEIATCLENPTAPGSSAIASLIKNKNIIIYPNPARNFVTLEMERVMSDKIIITIKNLNGKNVFSKTIKQMDPIIHLKEILDVQSLQNGIYFIQIIDGNKISTKKIQIQ